MSRLCHSPGIAAFGYAWKLPSHSKPRYAKGVAKMHSSTKRLGVILISVAMVLAGQFSANATFPGKNGRIAFGRFDPNIGDLALFTANPDGTDVQQLTFVPSLFSD